MRSSLVLLLLLGAACRSAPEPRAAADLPQSLVRVTKGACNARCATYEFEASASGVLRYTGLAHVRMAGAASAVLDAATVQALEARLAAVDPAGWPTQTDPHLVDAQAVTVTLKGVTYRYLVGGDAPPALEALVADVETLLEVSRWVTGGETR